MLVKKIDDSRTPLFLPLIELIKKINPKYVMIENVPSFMKSFYKLNLKETIQEKFNKEIGLQL